MKKCMFLTVTVGGIILGVFCRTSRPADQNGVSPALVPQPLRLDRGEGAFFLNSDTAILVQQGSADAENVGRQLADRLNSSTGLGLRIAPAISAIPVRNTVVLAIENEDAAMGGEGYRLSVTTDGVALTAGTGPGLFYGVQTLLQLLPPEVFSAKVVEGVRWSIPAVRIEDRPRFPWRGLMLDVSRHFFNKQEIQNFLDLMAQHKLNTFHWHLTDDQGWRIEIKRYPKLTEFGAWRKEIGFGFDAKESTAYGSDGRYGGFFSQDDVREIVAYAKQRYITIVPEIEMPGHAAAALAGYPELSCSGGPFTTDLQGGVHAGIYCAGNDAAFEFLQNVLLEVCELFPSRYIHIGGDEVGKNTWKKCEKCQARIRQEGLKGEKELQSYFIRRIEKFLNAHGRTVIGWDEILEGGLAPNATVMSWRGIKGGVAAANAGHNVVMTPTSNCYFDDRQAPMGEPRAHGGNVLSLEKVYRYEPVPKEIAADKVKHILGAGGNLWSEYIPNYAHVQYMAYPRGCAMAEVTWTKPERKNWDDFQRRLETHLKRLDIQGVKYRSPLSAANTKGTTMLTLSTSLVSSPRPLPWISPGNYPDAHPAGMADARGRWLGGACGQIMAPDPVGQ